MAEIIDFQKFKEAKTIKAVGFKSVKEVATCPFCAAPTNVERTGNGTPIHTFNGVDMETYNKLKELVQSVVDYFKNSDEDISDDSLTEAFGQGMADFLKEQQNAS